MNPNQAKNKMNVNNILQNQPLKNMKGANNLGSQINGINPNGIFFYVYIFANYFESIFLKVWIFPLSFIRTLIFDSRNKIK